MDRLELGSPISIRGISPDEEKVLRQVFMDKIEDYVRHSLKKYVE